LTVHDIDVNPVGSCLFYRKDFFTEFAEIGGKYGRGDFFHGMFLP
jgi:hypothetical protein